MVESVETRSLGESQPSSPEGKIIPQRRRDVVSRSRSIKVVPAIIGGNAAFEHPRVVGRPNMPDRRNFLERIDRMYSSGWLSNYGPMVQEFEELVAGVANAKHCIATCNGTVALELTAAATNMVGEVIVPAFTFVATVHSLWRQGIKPVFCDIDPVTHCLDPKSVEAAVTDQTTGILGVTLWGNRVEEETLREIADQHGLSFVLDSAHSFGCDLGRCGARGLSHAETFSFHATKCIHSIEGGAIVTNDDELAQKLRLMVNFGFEQEDTVVFLGTNGKMTEASAAMGITSIETIERIFDHNLRNTRRYAQALGGEFGITIHERVDNERHNNQYVVAEIDSSVAGLTRDELVGALRFENIVARRYFHPGCHRMEPYKSMSPWMSTTLPVTEAVSERVFLLPNGLAVSEDDVSRITERISAILANAKTVRLALASTHDERIPPNVPLGRKQ